MLDVFNYFEPDAWAQIVLSHEGSRSILASVRRAWRQRVLDFIRGIVPEETWFETITTICKNANVDISSALRPDDQIKKFRALDEMVLEIRRRCVERCTGENSNERRLLEHELMWVVGEYQVALEIEPNVLESAEVTAILGFAYGAAHPSDQDQSSNERHLK